MKDRRLAHNVVIGIALCAMLSGPCLVWAASAVPPLAPRPAPAAYAAPVVLAAHAPLAADAGYARPLGEQETPVGLPPQQRYWLGEDGAPLPFRSDDDIKDFLLTADVIEIQPIKIGVTKPQRVTLEKNGVRAHAVFRHLEKLYQRNRMRDGRLYVNFRDSFRFEPAAYELARLLGMNNVPPTVQRRVGHRNGTLQIWVYSSLMESDRIEQRLSPPDGLRWARQRHLMILFDALIGNTDRNAGNILIDGNWNCWLIDHTRAFYARARYERLDDVAFVERTFWNRLRELNREQLDEVLGGHISGTQIGQVLERRERLVEVIEGLIAERGEELVLYDAAAR